METVTLIILSASIIPMAYCLEESTYNQETSLSGKIPSDVRPLSARSMYECATFCSSDKNCTGVYYSEALHQCFLDRNFLADFQVHLNAVYLAKSDGVDASQRVVSSTACPQTFQGEILLLGYSGNYYRFTVSHTALTKLGAAIMCSDLGLQLIKVNDETKILDVADFLNTCAAYNSQRYWTDAERGSTGLGNSWFNSDGTEANLTNLWCAGSDSDNCLRFRVTCSYKLNDYDCLKKASVICE